MKPDREFDTASLQKKLTNFDRQSIIRFYNLMGAGKPDKKHSEELLIKDLLDGIENAEKAASRFELFGKYLDLYPKIDVLPKNLVIKLFDHRYKKTIKNKNKSVIIDELEKLVFKESIDFNALCQNVEKYSVFYSINKIRDLDSIKYLAGKVGQEFDDDDDIKKIVKSLLVGLEYKKYSHKDLEKHLAIIKSHKKTKKTSENVGNLVKEIEFVKMYISSIEKKMELQQNEIGDIKKTISDLIGIMQSNHREIESYFDKLSKATQINSTEKLVNALRNENLKLTSFKSESFDLVNKSLKENNFSDINIFRDGLAIVIMDYLMKLTKEMEWNINLDDFYRILSEETKSLVGSMTSSVKIPLIRDAVCKRIEIEPKKFDSLLLKCREKEWLLLEVGTPIGETNVEWLDTGKNRYYYLKLKRR